MKPFGFDEFNEEETITDSRTVSLPRNGASFRKICAGVKPSQINGSWERETRFELATLSLEG